MKKKWILIPALVLSVACAVGGTLAYFTHSETAHNVITAGNVEIALVEKQLAENGKEVDCPEDPIENVMPGTKVSKIVRVENLDDFQDCWVRVKITPLITLADGTKVDAAEAGVVVTTDAPKDASSWIASGGYFYHKTPVKAGKTTGNLMEQVTFADKAMGNKYQNCTVDILVEAQAVQYKNNEAGNDVLKAAGWPKS